MLLPRPVSSSRKPTQFQSYLHVLRTRTRLTNLAVCLLAGFAAISFLFNLSFLASGSSAPYSIARITETIHRPKDVRSLNHLIMVPCHAIWTGRDPSLRLRDDQWILEPYQHGAGRIAAFVAHVLAGAERARADEHSLLIYSGGQTRPSSTTTEAESYLRLAVATNAFQTSATFARATTEDHALDSYQNLLFSIARFHEYTGRYPEKITVVGYEFKRARFEELHRTALRWPKDRFHYVGLDPAEEDHLPTIQEGERNNGYLPYTKDLYGCHSPLVDKRKNRNRFSRFHPYFISSPEMSQLLDWCPGVSDGGTATLFPGTLPWA